MSLVSFHFLKNLNFSGTTIYREDLKSNVFKLLKKTELVIFAKNESNHFTQGYKKIRVVEKFHNGDCS
ncbi:hypothetical protein A1343_10560 [Leptospira interrogans serovar Bataviae]|nr:hypothetical protein [Leptospira interrogans serovar Bataviae]OAM73314.1 hypothetical protein A1343_10560 [Leptospira interrogans serovar Bataviae]